MKRNNLFWGIILISFGGIFFLDAIDILPGYPPEYLWQIFLILLGSWIILNSYWKPKYEKYEHKTIALAGATRAKIHINHGAGLLNINSGTTKGDLLTYSSMGTIQQSIRREIETLEVRLSPGSDIFPLLGFAEGFNWDLQLSEEIPLSLILETGASQTNANLNDLNITDLKLSTGASTSSIILPSKPERSNISINAGVASLNIHIPTNVDARIRFKEGLTSLTIDKDRFTRINSNTYQSQNFDFGTHRTEIVIEAGIGSISIN
ncbi:MAG: hypothetical protein ABIJ65_00710 [Chloroflexota bacterium]